MSDAAGPVSVVARPRAAPARRNLQKVPFVELWGGRLQGVVSSKSDFRRVYVSFVQAGSHEFYCSTNNNRQCGGLRGSPCKHIGSMLENAVAQYGADRVAGYLSVDTGGRLDWRSIQRSLTGGPKKEPANEVFSRFLNYLRYVRISNTVGPIPEMTWFLTG